MENCGRVNYGKTLDEQRKGTNCSANRWLCRCSVFLFFLHSRPSKKLINSVLRSTRKTLTYLSGLVGDIELNKHVLRDFIIHSLGMKPGFVNRFVSFNYNVVSFHVCVSLSLHLPAPDSIQLIISLLNPITAGTWRQCSEIKTQSSNSTPYVKHLKLEVVRQAQHCKGPFTFLKRADHYFTDQLTSTEHGQTAHWKKKQN